MIAAIALASFYLAQRPMSDCMPVGKGVYDCGESGKVDPPLQDTSVYYSYSVHIDGPLPVPDEQAHWCAQTIYTIGSITYNLYAKNGVLKCKNGAVLTVKENP